MTRNTGVVGIVIPPLTVYSERVRHTEVMPIPMYFETFPPGGTVHLILLVLPSGENN